MGTVGHRHFAQDAPFLGVQFLPAHVRIGLQFLPFQWLTFARLAQILGPDAVQAFVGMQVWQSPAVNLITLFFLLLRRDIQPRQLRRVGY